MEEPKRKFVGGIENVNAKTVYEREHANIQGGNILGIDHDYFNKIGGLRNLINPYKSADNQEKKELLKGLLDAISRVPTYEEAERTGNVTPENSPAVFADDVKPYIQAIGEIVEAMKKLALQIKDNYEHGYSKEVDLGIRFLENYINMAAEVIYMEISEKVTADASEKGLHTSPLQRRYQKTLSGVDIQPSSISQDLEKITKRIQYAKELLEKGPLPGSFSFLRDDGNVTPVGWEPTDVERKQLEEKPKKIAP